MLEKSYIHHLKALMCGIIASRGQGHGHMFTMCHTSLKMALLLHKVGLVSRLMSTTVMALLKESLAIFCKPRQLKGSENGKEPRFIAEQRRKGEGHSCIIYSHHLILTHAFVPSNQLT